MSRLIVTDIDGVCLDYVNSFIKWVKSEYGWSLNPESNYDKYSMESWFIGGNSNHKMTKEDFIRLITEYNSQPRVIPPVEHSQEALKRLKERGNTIVALSSFGGNHSTRQFRKEYLEMLFPKIFDKIILLDLGVCKKEELKKLKPDFFIEDHKEHAEKAAGLGITTFLIRTSYNYGAEDVIYVDNWNEINYIIGDKDKLKEAV